MASWMTGTTALWIALVAAPLPARGEAPGAPDAFDAFLAAPHPPADGFDLPVGDGEGGGRYQDPAGRRHQGWYVATHFKERYALGLHPGEDWNGRGGGDSDLGQPVRAIGHGRVVVAKDFPDPWGKVVVLEHLYYENHQRRTLRSLYAHLSRIDVTEGALVRRQQTIGAIGKNPAATFPAHLHLELRTDLALETTYWPSSHQKDLAWIEAHYLAPRAFIEAHRHLPVPQEEARLVLVDTRRYRMRLYEGGQVRAGDTFEVGFGQAKGRKRRRGDNRTPRGVYFVIRRHRGEIGGPYGAYYGGHWIKVNYPGPHDAAWGEAQGLITRQKARAIERAWRARRPTDQKTVLGSGIGFHGWKGAWEGAGGAHLSWGCIVMHNQDIAKIYDWLAERTMVVVF